ncbi:hypothetical protein PaecuDRAFT_2415 [Paenibacillus curdlanolyticus YK9]|uniref:Uncharacterized protein n=1 Tax=Paenibacillus curdlanolyticus YK9 TaxID=717606 RepID=E0I9S8_9BACL|nr:hypothetical protein [Paenibacillus curdlanolyticus]EFM11162.1 hypothetical protein PaecuDRAFT_2415 [Paenibacillus curdlanolyticus YK9]
MKKQTIIILLGIAIILFIYSHFTNQGSYSVNNFLNDKNIVYNEIVEVNNKYYIFNDSDIYIYKNKSEYNHSTANQTIDKNALVGGLEKGSVGLILNDLHLATRIVHYSVIVDGVERLSDTFHKKGANFVIVDDRIWNPHPNFTVKLLDLDDNELLRLDL